MTDLNLAVGWIAILFGLLGGVGAGLFFHDEAWLGGYASWPRRLVRLGHIAWFGTGFLNLLFVFSIAHMRVETPVLASRLFAIGAVSMPVVCYLSAFRKPFRQLFFIPVLSLIGATVNFLFVCAR